MRLLVAGLVAIILVFGGLVAPRANSQPDYTLFESGPVRPIAISPDGNRLFVVNTPDGYLEIFDVSSGSAVKEASVPVGLEPVAVAARNNDARVSFGQPDRSDQRRAGVQWSGAVQRPGDDLSSWASVSGDELPRDYQP